MTFPSTGPAVGHVATASDLWHPAAAVPVWAPRELLIVDLRTYGEDAVADALSDADEPRLQQIFDRADHYLYSDEFAKPSGASPVPC